MAAKSLRIDSLELDLENPRIVIAANQRDAMQKILSEQAIKLIVLAESIASNGLSPIDRFLVVRSERAGKFVVLEGNRRVLALKLLKNPTLVNDLEMPEAYRKRLIAAGHSFKERKLDAIDCFEVDDRTESVEWIVRRHTGENGGRGIVDWSGLAAARFRGRDPGLQALDFVLEHGDITDEVRDQIATRFPISTLERLLATPSVRSAIGFDIKEGKLQTELPADEALKPLRRMVIDLATDEINVTKVKSKKQQEDYISGFKSSDKPDLKRKSGTATPVDSLTDNDFAPAPSKTAKKPRAPKSAPRTSIVPKTCRLNITNAKIEKIYGELKTLQLAKHVHAIGVLLRVFLEMSVDEYLVSKAGEKLTFVAKGGHTGFKTLASKVKETISHMVANGATEDDFKGVTAGLNDRHHPFAIDTLHAYIHNRFFTPTEGNLVTGWDNAQRFFETIWS